MVKWYDPAKGHGFLVPSDGSPDICCGKAVLAAVGLDTLLAGATVACETAPGRRGPEVSRIHAVDYSTASPRTAFFARTSGNGPVAAEPGTEQAGAGASRRRVRALVKSFMPTKGYGFLEPEDGSADLFCHLTAVKAAGHDTLPDRTWSFYATVNRQWRRGRKCGLFRRRHHVAGVAGHEMRPLLHESAASLY